MSNKSLVNFFMLARGWGGCFRIRGKKVEYTQRLCICHTKRNLANSCNDGPTHHSKMIIQDGFYKSTFERLFLCVFHLICLFGEACTNCLGWKPKLNLAWWCSNVKYIIIVLQILVWLFEIPFFSSHQRDSRLSCDTESLVTARPCLRKLWTSATSCVIQKVFAARQCLRRLWTSATGCVIQNN